MKVKLMEKEIAALDISVRERCGLKNEPLVSMIIPVYNKGNYFSECLACVCRQTWKNIEIIVVDDGSTDESENCLRYYLGMDSRLKYYDIKHSGVSSARNEGLKHAQGEFIAFVDADDLIPHDYIESLLSAIGDADISICPTWKWNPSSGSVRVDSCDKAEFTRSEFLTPKSPRWLLCFVIYAKLFRTSFLRHNQLLFQESLDYGEDTVFFFNCLHHAGLINTTDQTYYAYRANTHISLVDINAFDLQTNRRLLSVYQQLFRQEEDSGIRELISWKQINTLYMIGRIESFLKPKGKKGSFFFSCAKEFHLVNQRDTGIPLSLSEAITRFTLRAGHFLPFLMMTRIVYKNAKEMRRIFTGKGKPQLDTIKRLTETV